MRRWLVAAALALGAAASHAASASIGFCGRTTPLTARQQDRLLRFADVLRRTLDDSGARVALISRSGLDLQRFDVRYSHAGIVIRPAGNDTWAVRQLYYACDEQRPRLYDQGLAGFAFGADDPQLGFVSLVLLPSADAATLERATRDKPAALRLIAPHYSANAFPFSVRYQNCNQWVAELLATSWGGLADAPDLRHRAQQWLADSGYAPPPIALKSHLLMFGAHFMPWVHVDDHPLDDLYAQRFRISMPASIEAFVRARLPGAERIELCHDERRVVVHRGWTPIADGCVPGVGDRVLAF